MIINLVKERHFLLSTLRTNVKKRPNLHGSVVQPIIVRSIYAAALFSTGDSVDKRFHVDELSLSLLSTVKKLAEKCKENCIDYAVIGGFAVNVHGFKRKTDNIDVLMTTENLEKFRSKLLYKGFAPKFKGSTKSFRDPESNVPIDIITSGQYPGDRKVKNISFPAPLGISSFICGVRVIDLAPLINLKLASYLCMKNERMVDRTDVAGLVKMLSMGDDFGERLHPDVVDEYLSIVKMVYKEEEDIRF